MKEQNFGIFIFEAFFNNSLIDHIVLTKIPMFHQSILAFAIFCPSSVNEKSFQSSTHSELTEFTNVPSRWWKHLIVILTSSIFAGLLTKIIMKLSGNITMSDLEWISADQQLECRSLMLPDMSPTLDATCILTKDQFCHGSLFSRVH